MLRPARTWYDITWMRTLVAVFLFVVRASAQSPETRTAAQMEALRKDPPLLRAFLREMPKGGDLHAHLEGSVYTETLIGFAAEDGLCVDLKDFTMIDPPCDATHGKPSASSVREDPALYSQFIDALSMRNWA